MTSAHRDWEDGLADVRAGLDRATRQEEKGRTSMTEARVGAERAERFQRTARSKADSAKTRAANARRMADEARRKSEEARRNDGSPQRWLSEVKRWQAEHDRAMQEATRAEDEGRRRDRDGTALTMVLRERMTELEALTRETRSWSQRFQYLTRAGPPPAPKAPDAAPQPPAVTERAIVALKATLDGTERAPDQLLRLILQPDGGVFVGLDTTRDGDSIISHEGSAILLIDGELCSSLAGRTVDLGELDGSTTIVFTD